MIERCKRTKDYPKEIDFPVSDTWLRHYQEYFEDKKRKNG